jgi:hypothetical protein
MWPIGRSKPCAELLETYRPGRHFHPRNFLPYLHGYGKLLLVNSLVLTLVVALLSIQYVFPYFGLNLYHSAPWDTFILIGLWLWCAYRVLADKEEAPAAKEERQPVAEDRSSLREPLHAAIADGLGSGQPGLRTAPS